MIVMEEKVSKPTLGNQIGNQNWGITMSFDGTERRFWLTFIFRIGFNSF